MPKLKVSLPDGTESTHELAEELITIGRIADNVIQIEDASVSGRHAQITLQGGHYHLKDLDSTNGTRVNGKNFTEGQLEEGDNLRFGKVDAVYVSDAGATTKPLPKSAEPSVVAAESSHRPADFSNASPFKTKKKKRDPIGAAIMAFAVLSMLAFAYAALSIFQLQPPQ